MKRSCVAPRPITQALPDRVVHANPGDVVDFTADEAALLDPLYWGEPNERPAAVKDVKAAVGDDVALAAEALEVERARAQPRTSLVEWLESVIAQHTEAVDTADDQKEA